MNTPLIHPPELLSRAEPLACGPEPIDWLQSGVLSRMALETHTRLMVQRRSLPWCSGPWYIRLRIAGIIDAADVAHLRELFDLGSRAVHNQPFDRDRAKLLLEMVSAFVEGSQHAI
jgi:hypothetical protein